MTMPKNDFLYMITTKARLKKLKGKHIQLNIRKESKSNKMEEVEEKVRVL